MITTREFVTPHATALAAHAANAQRGKKRDTRPLKDRLADAMLTISGGGQVVDREQLALRGFLTSELTDDNIRQARDIANTRAVRKVG